MVERVENSMQNRNVMLTLLSSVLFLGNLTGAYISSKTGAPPLGSLLGVISVNAECCAARTSGKGDGRQVCCGVAGNEAYSRTPGGTRLMASACSS